MNHTCFVQGEVQAALEDVCQYFGNMAGECKSLIEDFFPEIWNLLINEAVSFTLILMGRMGEGGREGGREEDKQGHTRDSGCVPVSFCCILTFLLPGIHTHTHTHTHAQSPDTICDLIGVCSSTTAVKKVCILYHLLSYMKTCITLVQQVSAPRSVSCAACTMVVMVIKEFVDNNRTEVHVCTHTCI